MLFAAAFPDATASLTVDRRGERARPPAARSGRVLEGRGPLRPRRLLPGHRAVELFGGVHRGERRGPVPARGCRRRAAPRVFRGLRSAVRRVPAPSTSPRDLGDISCPALVLVAEKDILKHAGFARIIAEGIPRARLAGDPRGGPRGRDREARRRARGDRAVPGCCPGRMKWSRRSSRSRGHRCIYVEQGRGGARSLRAREHRVPALVTSGSWTSPAAGPWRWTCRTSAGQEPLPTEPDLDAYADVVADFIRARGLERPVLVGHSLGGGVCISLAARFPGPHPGARARGLRRPLGPRDTRGQVPAVSR